MQLMLSIASYINFNFKLPQQCDSQSKPLGSLRWNLQVEGINRVGSRGDASPHQPYSTMLWINKILPLLPTSS